MTQSAKCFSCENVTGYHYQADEDRGLAGGWFCGDVCRAKVSKRDRISKAAIEKPLPGPPPKEWTPADQIILDGLVADGKIRKTMLPPEEKEGFEYQLIKTTHDPQEALTFFDRFERMDMFDRMMQLAFTNGIVDGIKTYQREIKKLGSLWSKSSAIGDKLLAYIAAQRK